MPLLTLESSVGNNLRQNPMGFAVHKFEMIIGENFIEC